MTPAEQKGLVVGQKYITNKYDNGVKAGTVVTFTQDDGSRCVKFKVDGAVHSDWLLIDSIDIVRVVKNKAFELSSTGDGNVSMTFPHPGAEKLKAILNLVMEG